MSKAKSRVFWSYKSRKVGPNPAQISIHVPQKSPPEGLLSNDFGLKYQNPEHWMKNCPAYHHRIDQRVIYLEVLLFLSISSNNVALECKILYQHIDSINLISGVTLARTIFSTNLLFSCLENEKKVALELNCISYLKAKCHKNASLKSFAQM